MIKDQKIFTLEGIHLVAEIKKFEAILKAQKAHFESLSEEDQDALLEQAK